MKKWLVCALLVCSASAMAEERQLLVTGEMDSGGLGGPMVRMTQLQGEDHLMVGGYGAWLVNHHFYLGGGGFSSIKDVGDYGNFSYGGLLLGTFIRPFDSVHYYADCLISSGDLQESSAANSNLPVRSDGVMLLEPSAGVAMNVAKVVKVNAGVSYRHVSGVDYAGISNSDLSGTSFNISVVFGVF
ncbi:MAG: hypothetical protein OEW58_06665 [Gammaproteobacteria bacterium]|nr:hypothetical protein [Gammaproteobacteria bacterium]